MDTLWSPIKESGNLTERIVARIEQLIRQDHLEVGQRLPSEREMARLLGVSRPALREAVKTLEAHDQLVVRHGQGVFVGSGDPESVRSRLANLKVNLSELFAMRQVLEVPAAAWAAAAATPEEIDELSVALQAEEEARRSPIDFGLLGHLDARFHLLIVETAKNRFLHQTLGVLQEMLAAGMETTLTLPGRLERSREDHRLLFEAIRDRDPEAARVAAASHILGAREAAFARIRSESALVGDEGEQGWEPADGGSGSLPRHREPFDGDRRPG